MGLRLRERFLPVLGLVVVAGVPPATLLYALGGRMVMMPMKLHFVVVGIAGLGTFAAALALSVVGARRRDGRAVLIGIAFTTMASMLFVHALATPTVLVGANGLVQLAGAGNLPAGAAVLALSAVPALRRPESVRPLFALQAAILAAVTAVGAVGMLRPRTIPVLPGPGGAPALALMLVGLALLGLLAQRAARTHALTRRGGDRAVGVGVVLLACALGGLLMYGPMDLGFWLAHVFEVAGLALIGLPTALDLRRGAQSYPLAGDLSAVRLVSEEEQFLGARIRALMVRLAEKDPYTEQHTRRVALLAVQVGERMGLAPARLRTLATGGLLHDMGKLAVADEILQKPGPLAADEFAVIRRHPVWGHELLNEVGGFSPEVHRLVLDHHERPDGGGYPRGIRNDALDVETRILTVCDVYDALITTRVYRDAWTPERALGLLHEQRGTAFDSVCVDALERVLERQDGEVLVPAAELRPALAI